MTTKEWADRLVYTDLLGRQEDGDKWYVCLWMGISETIGDEMVKPLRTTMDLGEPFDTKEEAEKKRREVVRMIEHIIRFTLNAAREGKVCTPEYPDLAPELRRAVGRRCENCIFWKRSPDAGRGSVGECKAVAGKSPEALLRIEVRPSGSEATLVVPEDFHCGQFQHRASLCEESPVG